jgi:hypothetical protein
VSDADEGEVKLEQLKAEELPESMRSLSADERKQYLDKKRKERAVLQDRINALTKRREAYIADEKQRLAKEHKADSFDDKVAEIVTQQYEAKR